MEAVARLAGGVAHDFNNLLMVISASADFLRQELPNEGQTREDVDEIARAASRAAGLTRRLLAFSRQQILKPQILSLADLVTRTLPKLQTILGANSTISVTVSDATLSTIRADVDELVAMLEALVANAHDAMPDGGTVNVEIKSRTISHTESVPLGVASGDFVVLVVRDSGIGMDTETKTKAFEPFFTTRRHLGATGMGLAAVYGIVRQLNGSIVCESEPGRGTTFEILIPAVERTTEAAQRMVQRSSTAIHTVLVVDDEGVIRNVVKRVLEHAGYHVELAESAETALAFLIANAADVDVLLTDVIMPGMDGNALAQRVAADFPHIGIAIMSGYVDQAQARASIAVTPIPFLAKPFERAALEKAISDALEQRRPAGGGAVRSRC